jgi:hypothetical protein
MLMSVHSILLVTASGQSAAACPLNRRSCRRRAATTPYLPRDKPYWQPERLRDRNPKFR